VRGCVFSFSQPRYFYEVAMEKPPSLSRTAQRLAREKRVAEFRERHGIYPAAAEYKAEHLARGRLAVLRHIARYHGAENGD
jgi:ABC-type antimicrobial peptide transport system ATPase subunit